MDHPCWNGGLGIYRIGYTKFNKGCTKICEGCTKGLKMHSEVGIGPKSLYYGFLNEIMDHPRWNGGLGICRFGCTKFNEGCTKFCEECTKGPKMRSEVGIDPQSLCYGFLKAIMDHPCWNGGPESSRIRCTKFNEGFTKFNEGCTKFCQGCTKGSKVWSEVGIGPKSLCYGFLSEIVAHPWSEEGSGITKLGCTKFNEECTKGLKMSHEVGIDP